MPDPAENIVDETDRGRSTRTPFLALTGVTLVVGALVAVVFVLAFLAYYLS
jgi:hypothetical protein